MPLLSVATQSGGMAAALHRILATQHTDRSVCATSKETIKIRVFNNIAR